jgi:hypothetical protein
MQNFKKNSMEHFWGHPNNGLFLPWQGFLYT